MIVEPIIAVIVFVLLVGAALAYPNIPVMWVLLVLAFVGIWFGIR